jgi:isoquinoline 1-oxidoreductase beta subunit
MLISAGAQTFAVPTEKCYARNSQVIHRTSGRSLNYAELVSSASKLPIPKSVPLKEPEQYRLIGTPALRLDLKEKLNGSARFGIDIKRPEMLYATLAQSPVFGGQVKSFNASTIKKRKGVVDCFSIKNGVVVVARDTWQAFQARKALEIEWDNKTLPLWDTQTIVNKLSDESKRSAGTSILTQGQPLSHLKSEPNLIESQYLLPFQAHMTPEPMNCTVHFQGDRIKIWAPTQSPTRTRSSAINVLRSLKDDLALESDEDLEQRIEVQTPLLGGGFGRRILQDYVAQAVKIAYRFSQPVQLVWPREEDVQHDFYHPFIQHWMRGAVDPKGMPLLWHHRITGLKANKTGADELPYKIPHIQVDLQSIDSQIPIGPWRSVSNHYHAFAIEHFFDELALAAHHDPLEMRLKLLNQPRLKHTLEVAAEITNWQQQGKERTLGCAVHSSFGSHVTEVVEIITHDGKPSRLGKVTCVVDCGQVVNPDTLKAQMEGAVMYGLTAALKSNITLKNGQVVQSNFHNCPILAFHEAPQVDVQIVSSQAAPGGIGEPGVPPIAPAFANALLASTGQPTQQLPVAPF